ncbi:Diaminopimelate epimerase-like protein [Poronia punctata]|nr:Diaminopimelate epimerase-like protein [Poronia punctata]
MELPFTTLDVFTTQKFEGNPLAVVQVPASLRSRLTQEMKQKIAKEFNLSETVFLHEETSESTSFFREIDIFTTLREIPFAGHPVIGSAVFARHYLHLDNVRYLLTKAGTVRLDVLPSLSRGIMADVPHNGKANKRQKKKKKKKKVRLHATTLRKANIQTGLSNNNDSIRTAELDAPIFSIVNGMTFLLVRVDTLEQLGRVAPPPLRVEEVSGVLDEGWRDSLVGRYYYYHHHHHEEGGEGEICLRTRMMEGEGGEDAATGSAALALASYITLLYGGGNREEEGGERLGFRSRFRITQGVEMGRKSVISVETDSNEDKIWLGGSAVVVMRGTLDVDDA